MTLCVTRIGMVWRGAWFRWYQESILPGHLKHFSKTVATTQIARPILFFLKNCSFSLIAGNAASIWNAHTNALWRFLQAALRRSGLSRHQEICAASFDWVIRLQYERCVSPLQMNHIINYVTNCLQNYLKWTNFFTCFALYTIVWIFTDIGVRVNQ